MEALAAVEVLAAVEALAAVEVLAVAVLATLAPALGSLLSTRTQKAGVCCRRASRGTQCTRRPRRQRPLRLVSVGMQRRGHDHRRQTQGQRSPSPSSNTPCGCLSHLRLSEPSSFASATERLSSVSSSFSCPTRRLLRACRESSRCGDGKKRHRGTRRGPQTARD